jgi:hypothetical protein
MCQSISYQYAVGSAATGSRKGGEMRNDKIAAIEKKLNCHKGFVTLDAVWAHLPKSCERLPRNITADILNACNQAYHSGRNAAETELEGYIGIPINMLYKYIDPEMCDVILSNPRAKD